MIAVTGIHRNTLRTLVGSGAGPEVVQLSPAGTGFAGRRFGAGSKAARARQTMRRDLMKRVDDLGMRACAGRQGGDALECLSFVGAAGFLDGRRSP
jgi:hypothetical protein